MTQAIHGLSLVSTASASLRFYSGEEKNIVLFCPVWTESHCVNYPGWLFWHISAELFEFWKWRGRGSEWWITTKRVNFYPSQFLIPSTGQVNVLVNPSVRRTKSHCVNDPGWPFWHILIYTGQVNVLVDPSVRRPQDWEPSQGVRGDWTARNGWDISSYFMIFYDMMICLQPYNLAFFFNDFEQIRLSMERRLIPGCPALMDPPLRWFHKFRDK